MKMQAIQNRLTGLFLGRFLAAALLLGTSCTTPPAVTITVSPSERPATVLPATAPVEQPLPAATLSRATTAPPATETTVSAPSATLTPTLSAEVDESLLAFAVAGFQPIALVNGRVIDGTGVPAHTDWTIVIQGDRIVRAGPGLEPPAGAYVVDLMGQTVLPGLLDLHGHLYATDGRRRLGRLQQYLGPVSLTGEHEQHH